MTLQVDYIPLPPELEPAWRAGMLLLLQILQGSQEDTAGQEDQEGKYDHKVR